jgi:phosphopantothenoylcysteine decarboxylase/phosphopantothenate--cysteine ligase
MNKRVLFLMSGSIAAYKACQVLSRLKQLGHEVEVVASQWALRFVGEATIEGLTGRPVHQSMFGSGAHMSHIHLVRWADVVIVCPATANTIGKLANGIGDDLLTTLFLAHDFSKPWLIAPAMNTKMYHHPATRESVRKLTEMGCKILETASGVLACGEIGDGKLLDPDLLLQAILAELNSTKQRADQNEDQYSAWAARGPGRTRSVLITSGGTSVPIDAVRSITNHSTGRTGTALAEVFFGLGYSVTLVAAKSSIKPKFSELDDAHFKLIEYETFIQLQGTLDSCLATTNFDLIVHAAAVSDYSVADGPTSGKIDSSDEIILRLKKNPKLLDSLRSKSKNAQVKIVGFKFTADERELTDRAKKLAESGAVDLLVTNDLRNYPGWQLHQVDPQTRKLNLIESGADRHELGLSIAQRVTP